MAEVRTLGLKDKLWHELRANLAKIAPNLASDDRLICCLCGRLLPFEAFSLEHIIPQQALADDPPIAKLIPALRRSGRTLICNSTLKLKGKQVSQHGCNSWKGTHFDKALRMIFNGTAVKKPTVSEPIIISSLIAGYLALFTAFGYEVVFSAAGVLMRRQFFQPYALRPELPAMSQLLLMGEMPAATMESVPVWEAPFTFNFDEPGRCTVGVRNYVVHLPISRDPRLPIASALRFSPSKYKLRPDLRALFD